LLIERIRLLNFGPFYGEHDLVFPGDGSGVHLIRGDNGQGKTSIQRAVLWNLYGKVLDRKGQVIRPTSLLNRSAASEDLYQFGVVVYLSHEGEEWVISRKTVARSHSDRMYDTGMKVDVVKDGEPQPNPEHTIQRIIPHDVSRFFFFDGEMLRDYEELLDQTSRAMGLLRDSIEHVLGIPLLRIARDDLYEVQRRNENEHAKLTRRLGGKEYEKLVDDFQVISQEIDTRNKQVKEIEKQISQLETETADKKRHLTDMSTVRELARERIRLEEEVAQLAAARDREMDLSKGFAAQLYKTILVRSSEDIIARLQAKHEAAMERYNAKQRLLGQAEQIQSAMQSQQCKVCRTVLNKEKLEALKGDLRDIKLKIRELTEVPEPNLEYEDHVNRLKHLSSQMITGKTVKEVDERIMGIDHRISALKSTLRGLREKLAGGDEDEPRKLELEIEAATRESGRLQGLKTAEEHRNLEDLEAKAELDQQIRSIDREELSILAKRVDLVKSVQEVFDQSVSVYRDERREYVGSVASDVFRELRTKPSFSELSINQQFGLNIVTESGGILDRAEWRSSGEEQVVALALIGALNRCAHIKAPLFMDTPFGRLDTKHGKRVLTFLPKLAEQVVLLVTDREFRKEDEQYLSGYIKSDHTVIHRGEREGSRIVTTGG